MRRRGDETKIEHNCADVGVDGDGNICELLCGGLFKDGGEKEYGRLQKEMWQLIRSIIRWMWKTAVGPFTHMRQ